MKTIATISAITLALFFGGAGCNQNVDDPVFDYNLKSAQVIETNNNFGIDLLKTVFGSEEAPNIMISPAYIWITSP